MKRTRFGAYILVFMILCITVLFSSCGEHVHTPGGATRENEIAASCKVEGSYDEVVRCTDCGQEISRTKKTIDKLTTHTPGEWVTVTEATCKEAGTKHKVCTVCEAEVETGTIDKLTTHTPGEWVTVTEATCKEAGTKHKVCTVCEAEVETGTIDKLTTHTPGEWVTVTEATCKEAGTKHKVCTVCEAEVETGTIDKLTTHTPDEAVRENEVDSTCSAVGSYDEVVYCSVCDEEISRTEKEIAKKDHTHDEAVRENEVDSTCSAVGSYDEVVYCSVCDEEISRTEMEIEKKDHKPIVDPSVEATDTTDGLTEGSHCSSCGKVLVAQQVIPAALQGTALKSATLTVNGDRIYGSVSNTTTSFSFLNDITINGKASYVLSRYIECEPEIKSKTATLSVGDNTFYILVSNGNDMKLYTVTIRRLPMYNVSFDTNGGSAVDSQLVQEGNQISEPVIEKSYYDFVCWKVNGEEISFPYTVTENVEIEAIWTPTVYDINYNLNGGTNGNNPDTYTIETNTISLVNPTRAGYDFAGWYTNAEFTGNAVTEVTLGSHGNVELYAKWDIITYTIDYTLNGGANDSNPVTYTVETETIILAEPTRAGYGFVGWYTNADFTGDTVTEITLGSTGNIELYAKWEAIFRVSDGAITGLTDYGKANCTEIVIPSEIDGVSITSIGEGAFLGCSSLTNIIIPDSVTNIGFSAFSGCSSLESITIPFVGATKDGTENTHFSYIFGTSSKWYSALNYVPESLKTVVITGGTSIGNNAFYYYSSLTSIVIPNSVTSIGNYAFYGCSSLTSIVIPNSVTSIGNYAFRGCSSLTSITIPDNVTGIGKMAFCNCSSLASINVSEDNEYYKSIEGNLYSKDGKTFVLYAPGKTATSFIIPNSVTSIGDYAFYGCSSLTSVTIGNGVTSIGSYAFYGCSSLTSITIPDCVTSIGSYAFSGCNSLVEVYNLSSLDISSYFSNAKIIHTLLEEESILESVGDYVFMTWEGKYYLVKYIGTNTEIVLPENYNGNDYAIYDYAFYNCDSLTSIVIPDSVTSIGNNAFRNCGSLTSVTIGYGVTSIGEEAFYNCSSLTSITIPNSVTSIDNNAFSYCRSLRSVTIPGSVTSIGSYAFHGCSSLVSINVSEDNEYYKSIEGNLYSKDGKTFILYAPAKTATSFIIPNSVTSIGDYAFYGCSSLTSVTIGNGVTSIGNGAFSDCDSLESITLPFVGAGLNDTSNTHFGYIFGASSYSYNDDYVPTSLKTVVITGGTSIGDDAFSDCSSLTSITIPDSIISIGEWAFAYCSSLTSVTIGNGVTSIGNYAFSGCSSLTSIVIPNSVTSIGDRAFCYCSSLTSITIPNSVTSIGSFAFYGCSSLESITLPFVGATKDGTSNTHFSYIFGASNMWGASNYVPASLKTVVITGGTSIGSWAFNGCSSLTSITIPNSVTSIDSYAFSGCGKLVEVYNLSSLDVSSYFSNAKIIHTSLEEESILETEGDYVFMTWEDEYYLISYTGTDTEIVLPEKYKGNDYAIYDYAFYGCSSLTSITIGNGVTSIGDYAFSSCNSLTSITISDSVTSIGNSAFINCSSLTSITIPDSVTSIGDDAFSGCSSLTSITIPDSITSIGEWAFSGCSSLTSVTIGNGVTSIGNRAFNGCSSLTSITIPDSITSIGEWAFSDCSSLTSITIPNSVTSIGDYAFYGCSSLESITLPFVGATKDGTENTHFGYIFGAYSYYYNNDYVPTSLKTVVITGGTSIGSYAFNYCSSLTSITIPDSVTSIGSSAFYGCSSLTSVTIPNGVTSIGSGAFSRCGKLVEVYNLSSLDVSSYFSNAKIIHTSLEEESILEAVGDYVFMTWEGKYYLISYTGTDAEIVLPENYNGNDYAIYDYAFYNCSSLTSITIPNSITSIGSSAFYNCSSLTSIVIPDSVTSIGSYAFYGCSSLESITLPFVGATKDGTSNTHFSYIFSANDIWTGASNCVPASLKTVVITSGTSIGSYAFRGCSSLTSITIPNSVTSIDSLAFYNCSSLTSIVIPDSVTSISSSAFYNCSSLTSIVIPDSVTSISSSAFYGCSSLASINVSEDNEYYKSIEGNLYSKDGKTFILYTPGKTATSFIIPDSVTSIGSSAFYNCSSLTSITIPDSVTSIGSDAFYGCSSLTSVTIGNGVTSIGNHAFYDCDSLTSIVIPDSVTSIGDYAFTNCDSLTSITIPNSVTSISSSAFRGCSSLASINVSEDNEYYKSIEGNLYYKDGKTFILYAPGKIATSFIIPDSVTSIGDHAFSYCDGLTSVTISEGVESIGEWAFTDCTSLTSVTISEGVESIGEWVFSGCSSLTNITIPNSVTSIGSHAFSGCDSLTIYCEVTSKPSGWDYYWNNSKRPVVWGYTGSIGITEDGFKWASIKEGIVISGYSGTNTEIVLPEKINDVTVISICENAFYNYSSLTSITIPDSVTSIGSDAFYGCSSLTSVTIGNGVTSIGDDAFYDCDSLTSIVIPDSVTSIGSYAFRNCDSLTSVTIGNGVTSIGGSAFYNCSSLTSITIPDSVTSIGSFAFQNCSSLTIYCEATSKPSEWNSYWNYSSCPVVWGYNQ